MHSNEKNDKSNNKRSKETKKIPIRELNERNIKNFYDNVMLSDKDNKKLSKKKMLSVIDRICKNKSTIITNKFRGYKSLNKIFYAQLVIAHQIANRIEQTYTSEIKIFWNLFEHDSYKLFHHVSVKYLQCYIEEFIFRFYYKNINISYLIFTQSVISKLIVYGYFVNSFKDCK